MHALQGRAWPGDKGAMVSGMFPYPAFETLREDNPVFSTLFGYFNGPNRTLAVRRQATSASTEYVTGEYFRGLAVSPAAGRLIAPKTTVQAQRRLRSSALRPASSASEDRPMRLGNRFSSITCPSP